MANRSNRTAEKDALFLEALCDGKSVADACALSGYVRRTVYDWKRDDEDFAKAWEEAYQIGTQTLEDEARRRAFEGYDEPVFHDGKQCGTKRKYSDTLLMFILKARDPERYRDRSDVTTSGSIIIENTTFGASDDE